MRLHPVAVLIPFLLAAGYTEVPDAEGKWHPWAEGNGAAPSIKSAPETTAALATLEEIQKIFAKTKPLNPPRGVNVLRSRQIHSQHTKVPFASSLLMVLLDLERKTDCPACPLEQEHEGPSFQAIVNGIGQFSPQDYWFKEVFSSDGNVRIFSPPELLPETVGGYPVYQGPFGIRWVLITRKDRPSMFRPVKAGDAIQRLIDHYDAKIRKAIKAGRKPSAYEGDQSRLDAIRKDLAALSEAERGRDMWGGCGRDGKLVLRMCVSEPGPKDKVWPYVEFNPDFWDRTLPANQPQTILIDVMWRSDKQKPYRHRLATEVIADLDWKALGALVEDPPK